MFPCCKNKKQWLIHRIVGNTGYSWPETSSLWDWIPALAPSSSARWHPMCWNSPLTGVTLALLGLREMEQKHHRLQCGQSHENITRVCLSKDGKINMHAHAHTHAHTGLCGWPRFKGPSKTKGDLSAARIASEPSSPLNKVSVNKGSVFWPSHVWCVT